ncbi:MAG: riboflavin synthase [Steroidobacteraceae bacterium]
MFTGIVQTIGTVTRCLPKGGDVEIAIAAPAGYLEGTALGDSIACNGCCLTVTQLAEGAFTADVSRETLSLTTLGNWTAGSRVNLERALRAGDALGGHYVTGHVDGIATVAAVTDDARSRRVEFVVPVKLARYIARKGSVTVDGVSLTVNGVTDLDAGKPDARFDVNLVPHTLEATVLGGYVAGTRVNFEVDIIARYVERMMGAS